MVPEHRSQNKAEVRLQDGCLGGAGLQDTGAAAHTVGLITALRGSGDPSGCRPPATERGGPGAVATHSGLPACFPLTHRRTFKATGPRERVFTGDGVSRPRAVPTGSAGRGN